MADDEKRERIHVDLAGKMSVLEILEAASILAEGSASYNQNNVYVISST